MARGTKLDLNLHENFGNGWDVEKSVAKTHLKLQPKNDHQLVFKKEKRRGKTVTLVGRFLLLDAEKKEILTKLKKTLSCGGKIDEEWMEFQGEHKEKIIEILSKDGWKFR